jgi:hypothetical protein
MTTVYKEKTRCSVCGTESEFYGIASTSTFGSADLDSRPPELKRSTIPAWVQRCPECGLCESDLSKSGPELRTIVQSQEYRDQLNDSAFPKLANSFMCRAIICWKSRDYAAATWALIHAAWVCDDLKCADKAVECRQKAADMLVLAEEQGYMADQGGTSTVILVDLLRRSGRLNQARRVMAERREGITEEKILRILEFQSALIQKGDVSCHTIAEAFENR